MKANKNLHSVALASVALILFLILVSSTASAAPYAYITNSGDKTVYVINTETNKVTAIVDVGSRPEGVASSPYGTIVYVANRDSNTVSVIDTSTNTVTATVNGLNGPWKVAVTPDGTKVYVANINNNTVSIIDTATKTVTATVPVGNPPIGVAVTPDGKKVYVANGWENTVSVIDAATNTVTETVSVGSYPEGVAVTPDGTKVYVANANNNTVSIIDTATDFVTATVSVGKWPVGIAVRPDGTKVYVANVYDSTVSVIDTATNLVTATVPVGSYPEGVAVTPDGTKVYVTNWQNNTVSVIDTATNNVTATATNNVITTLNVGSNPSGVAVTKVYARIDTKTDLTSSANIFKFRQSVTLTATVGATSKKGTPSGTVTFFDGTEFIGNENVSSGQASLTTSSLSVGLHSITAKYSGDDKFKPNTSSAQVTNVPVLPIIFFILVILGLLLIFDAKTIKKDTSLFIEKIIKKGTDSRNKSPRNLEPVKTVSYPANIDRWAIIVGISKYNNESLNLKYADRDAEELHKLLLTPSGGGFKEDHIKKLINEEATTLEITDALRSFVQNAGEDDIFILYFACHGSPDPCRPDNIYLLTHDTISTNIAGTALPMREIYQSLTENLYSKRVVIFADACHSAAIGSEMRGIVNSDQAVNDSFQEISKARGGVALLTSTEANGSSQEGEQWGGGHGVFTYFLLQGMKGDADGCCGEPKDGIVTVGELFDYVSENVIKATNYKQHPAIGTTSFDRSLPISISSSD